MKYCANHPETPAVAYCQYCGKPLCDECLHKINNVVSCEPCLAARVGAANSGPYTGNPSQGPTWSGQVSPGNVRPPANWGVEPGIAIAIGWIPGVGAVYNGQIAKALIHVAVFAILIDLTHYNGLIGIFIPIWILYMWIDAYHTTVARRNGQPLPNPLGLNDVGTWFMARNRGPYPGWAPPNPNPGNPSAGAGSGFSGENPAPGAAVPPGTTGIPGEAPPVSGFASGFGAPPYTAYAPPPIPPMPPVPPNQYDMPDLWHSRGRGVPTGAVILILIGVGFLLANVGVLSEYWIDRGWPVILIAIGVWIVIRRTQTPPPPSGGAR